MGSSESFAEVPNLYVDHLMKERVEAFKVARSFIDEAGEPMVVLETGTVINYVNPKRMPSVGDMYVLSLRDYSARFVAANRFEKSFEPVVSAHYV